jgi:hypothetical protein
LQHTRPVAVVHEAGHATADRVGNDGQTVLCARGDESLR